MRIDKIINAALKRGNGLSQPSIYKVAQVVVSERAKGVTDALQVNFINSVVFFILKYTKKIKQ